MREAERDWAKRMLMCKGQGGVKGWWLVVQRGGERKGMLA